jgi:hypothetical protein
LVVQHSPLVVAVDVSTNAAHRADSADDIFTKLIMYLPDGVVV